MPARGPYSRWAGAGRTFPPAMSDEIQDRLRSALQSSYTIERELGAGGMATVYLAHDIKHDRQVALKVLRGELAQSIGRERFLREIQLAAKLTHPHILPLFDSGDADGVLYYVMPNVEGHSLRDRLANERLLPIAEAVRIASEVARALDYAHRQGVVHRDIKPENIMLQDGQALVADFGIGKALSAIDGHSLTQAGMSVGTPAYMSPEQAVGEEVDGRSDIYSLGCVLYEMIAGEQPFTGPTIQAVIAKRFVQTPTDVAALREGVPRPVARAVQRALARAPIDRYDTASLFVTSLSEVEAVSATLKPAAPEKSLAVLPFANMSADPENEFFADGITEEILNALSQIPDLRVAGRASSFSFKGKTQDLRAVGEQLNVRTVLEGSVRRSGNRVRITAQLSDATDGFRLWSERYDREIDDVFAVQDEIASAIAAKLKTTLAGAASQAQRQTDNIEAYEAYLKGRALLYRRGGGIKLGLVMMEKALALDPAYAVAWAGLADAYSLMGYYGSTTPEVARAKAGEAAAKALQYGPDLAEVQSALGLFTLWYEWDWAGAERAFKRAIELNPAYVQGVGWYYIFYVSFVCGRREESRAGCVALTKLDPLSAYLAALTSASFSCSPTPHPDALPWAEKAIALAPDSYLSKWMLQLAHHSRGDWEACAEAADAAAAAFGRPLPALANLGLAAVATGHMDEARAIYDEIRLRGRREHAPPMCVAMLAAGIGERDVAVAFAREAQARHDPLLPFWALQGLGVEHLRALPEFQAILTEINFPGWINPVHT